MQTTPLDWEYKLKYMSEIGIWNIYLKKLMKEE